jgi:hypothetical protein
MSADPLPLRRQVTILAILMVASFGFRLVPYLVGTSFVGQSQAGEWNLWNANPVWALFLLAFARCRIPWIGILIPLIGYILTDLVLEWILASRGLATSSISGRLTSYALFIALSHLGWIIRKLPKDMKILERGASILSVGMLGSVLFFIISNGIVWLTSKPSDGFYYYPPTWDGMIRCYQMAFPFFTNSFLGDIVFVAFFFAVFAGVEQWILARQEKRSLAVVEVDQ